ncbi:CLUMA_CG018451, isoform A [Clunio marinus]|uniref:CLUMA_CG018451, isoform A n=1 Tax=Clunio marinus TaxID=568069 RepID=A0A1J1IYW3_9DIPT|nr:CLUMA_CG018451, isoform A [Clunio marinus]
MACNATVYQLFAVAFSIISRLKECSREEKSGKGCTLHKHNMSLLLSFGLKLPGKTYSHRLQP